MRSMPFWPEVLRAAHEEDPFSTLVISRPGLRDGAVDPARGILTVLTGLDSGRVVRVEAHPVTLGRSVDCTLCLADQGLSRVHAQVMREGVQYTLEDRGSRNGTFVNGRRVTQKAQLQSGDRIAIGAETEVKFSVVSPSEQQTLEQTYEKATTDGLTGLYNRAQLDLRLGYHVQVARREGQPLALAILDVDHFKKVNDTHGHLAGDEVLRRFGQLMRELAEPGEMAARYGGEEFVFIGRYTDALSHGVRVDQVRQQLGAMRFPVASGAVLQVTCSAGVAGLDEVPESGGAAALLALADERLYQAKQRGRNRVIGP